MVSRLRVNEVEDLNGNPLWRSGEGILGNVTTSTGTQTVGEALDRRGIQFTALRAPTSGTFNPEDYLETSTKIQLGAYCYTLGYYTPGDGGGNDYEIVDAATGADDGGVFIGLSGSGRQAKGLFTDGVAKVKQFGALLDDLTDDTASAVNFLSNAPTYELDMQFLTARITSSVSVTRSNPVKVCNTSLRLDTASELQGAVTIAAPQIEIASFKIDGGFSASKLLQLRPTQTDSIVDVRVYEGIKARQTDTATGFAAGLFIQPDTSGMVSAKAILNDITCSEITSTKATDPFTKGVWVQDVLFVDTESIYCDDITPVDDADGIAVTMTLESDRDRAVFNNRKSYYKDCSKRAVKSQVAKSDVTDIVIERTVAYPGAANDQVDIDLQYNGHIDRATFYYADGAHPYAVVGVSSYRERENKALPSSAKNLTIVCENPDTVINWVVSHAINNPTTLPISNFVVSDIDANCFLKNVVRYYATGTTQAGNVEIDNAEVDNVSFRGFFNDPEIGIVRVDASSMSYLNVTGHLSNITTLDGSKAPIVFGDNSGFLSYKAKTILNCSVDNAFRSDIDKSPVQTFHYPVAENGSLSIPFPLSHFSASALVMVTYTSSRADGFNKLHTFGSVQAASGATATYYNEMVAGIKSSAACGGISIIPGSGAQAFTVQKTAGSQSSSGYLSITVISSYLS